MEEEIKTQDLIQRMRATMRQAEMIAAAGHEVSVAVHDVPADIIIAESLPSTVERVLHVLPHPYLVGEKVTSSSSCAATLTMYSGPIGPDEFLHIRRALTPEERAKEQPEPPSENGKGIPS